MCQSHKLPLSILPGPSLNIKFLNIFLSEFATVDFIPFPLQGFYIFSQIFFRLVWLQCFKPKWIFS